MYLLFYFIFCFFIYLLNNFYNLISIISKLYLSQNSERSHFVYNNLKN